MKLLIIIAIATISATARADRAAVHPSHVTRAIEALDRREPSLSEIRAAALREAGLNARPEADWSRRSRLSGLLPVVTISADHGKGSDHDMSRSSSGTERLDVGSDEDFGFQAKAVWHFDRVVFSDTELRAVQAAERRQRARTQLLTRVTSLYFQRRKLQVTVLYAPIRDPGKAALHALAIAELTGQLDALTGGYVSARAARAASERARRGGR